MMKRLLSMMAVLAISLLTACAQQPTISECKSCPVGMDCCGYCPCAEGYRAYEDNTGKGCDPEKHKPHKRRHHKPKAAPVAVKDSKAAPAAPAQEKPASMFDGVKKIIQDVGSKDAKKPQ